MRKNQIAKNASAATLQVLVSGLFMFLLYRYLLASIGVEKMGIWSVVLATTSASRITELGLTAGVVKYVAKYLAHNDSHKAADVIQTAVISLAVFIGIMLLAAYFPLCWILARVLPVDALTQGLALLPYSLVSLWIASLSGIFQSGLDGCQRADLRAGFNILNSVLYLALAIALIPLFGLLGLAFVQTVLAVFLLLLSWIFLRRELTTLPYFPWQWNRTLFREMILYGVNIQLGSIIQMLYDPVTKSLLSRFGDLGMVGYYEMASRMIMQFRSLLTAPNQVMVPVIAHLHETEPERIRAIYTDSCRLQAYLSVPVYAGIVALIPGISHLWIGFYEPTFVLFSLLLVAGWFLNGFCNPAYFSNLGIGDLTWNMAAHVAIGILNAALGAILGFEFGGIGVVTGWAIALALGSSVIIFAFHHSHAVPLRDMFPVENGWLLASCVLGIAVVWLSYVNLPKDLVNTWVALSGGLVFLANIAIPAWRHPMRVKLLKLLPR